MVKSSDFSEELETEFITIGLYKKHLTYMLNIKRNTKKGMSQQIRDLIDKEIKDNKYGNY